MHGSTSAIALAALGASLALFSPGSSAQLGLYQLPRDDFRWNWGTIGADERRGMADIEVSGAESFFHCDLSARTRASSSLSPSEVRQIESDLRTRLDFIYAAAQMMNYLEQTRDLDWAVLDCKKNEREELSAEESEARQSAAREKMLRELERRRARQQRESN